METTAEENGSCRTEREQRDLQRWQERYGSRQFVEQRDFDRRGPASESMERYEALYGMELDAAMVELSQCEENSFVTDRPGTPEPRGEEERAKAAAGCDDVGQLWTRRESLHRERGRKDRVTLNVGGRIFETSEETLSFGGQSMLAAKVARHRTDKDEVVWLDRDPERFRHVLNYLRSQTIWLDEVHELRGVQEEAEYFGIDGLIQLCEYKIQQVERGRDEQMKRVMQKLEELEDKLKAVAENLDGQKQNHHFRKEPISGVRRRRLDYVNYNEPVFRMDEDF